MIEHDPYGINEFREIYPEMSLKPSPDNHICLSGDFVFEAKPDDKPKLKDSYYIEIYVPSTFPREIPIVFEIGGRIPRDIDYHIYTNPGNLCMGTKLRLLNNIHNAPSLSGFAHSCLVPYLYGMSIFLEKGIWPFGALGHSIEAEIEDYANLLGLKTFQQIRQAFRLLSLEKRYANKSYCPCGCRRPLKQCSFRNKLNYFRRLAPRPWFVNFYIRMNDIKKFDLQLISS